MNTRERFEAASERAVKPQACLTCRAKKVKCDGVAPACGTCVEHHRDCVYDRNGPKKRSRVSGSRRDRQAKAKAARLSVTSSDISSLDVVDSIPQRATGRVPQPHLGVQSASSPPGSRGDAGDPSWVSALSMPEPEPVSASLEGKNAAERTATPELDVSEHVTRDVTGTVRVRGPTNTLYESGADAAPRGPKAPDALQPHPFASAILTASAAVERQKEAQYRSSLLAKGFIEGVPAELALHLLDVHWNRHHFFLLSYRPTFFRDMIHGGPFYSPLLLFAILAVSCRYSDRQEVGGGDHAAHSGKAFYDRAQLLLMDELGRSSIPTATALLLMGNALVSGGQVDKGWLYTGMGIRMITNLGLHVEGDRISKAKDQRTVEEVEISRRLFWGAFISEKLQSLYLGRPIFMHGMDCHVPKELLDVYDEDEIWKPFPPALDRTYPVMATNSISHFTALCVLCEICEDIMSLFYPVKATATTKEALRRGRARIRDRLRTWVKDLLPKLDFTPWLDGTRMAPIHGVVLHTIYYSLVILSERPFVANGHLNHGEGEAASWSACTDAAEKIAHILRAYRELYTFRCVPYQLCYATYVASTILVRNANKSEGAAGIIPSAAHLEVCLKAFREMRVTHPGTHRMEERIRVLMGRLDVSVATPTFSTPRDKPNALPSELAAGDLTSPSETKNPFQAMTSPGAFPSSSGSTLPNHQAGPFGLPPSPSEPALSAYQNFNTGFGSDPSGFGLGDQSVDPYTDQLWNFQAADLNDDVLFGVLRDSWN